MACLERLLFDGRRSTGLALCGISLVVTWFLYVPVHELLHVLGCVMTGGSISELEVAPQYGGALLAKVFPFVVSGGEYAGRLSGFDWKGSDLIYLATDFLPFTLSVVIGVPLLHLCAKKRHPILFGSAVVLGFAPIYNLPGDYYEMGSILTTRVMASAAGGDTPSPYLTLRSDDVFKLIEEIAERPADTQVSASLASGPAYAVVAGGMLVAVVLAWMTYGLGTCFGRLFVGPPAKPGDPPATSKEDDAPSSGMST